MNMNSNHFQRTRRNAALIIVFLLIFSCEEFVRIGPPKDELSTSTVFANDAVAESAVRGIYTSMSLSNFAGGSSATVSALLGIGADELDNDVSAFAGHRENSLQSTDSYVLSNWASLYYIVYLTNLALEGIERSDGLTLATATRLQGEAKFLRAFCYFYLTNLWGDVPLVVSSSYKVNSSIPRTPAFDVYQQIISDLIDAKTLLPDDYSTSNGLRTRATRWAAIALLARTYLFAGEWSKAEEEATAIIDHTSLFELEPILNNVFLVGSKEAILQFYPTGSNINNSREARLFLPTAFLLSLGVGPSYRVSEGLLSSFEPDDGRREAWIDSVILNGVTYRFPSKYKVYEAAEQIEFTALFRLAEQYLIRSEARAQLGKLVGTSSAESDLNAIRHRAGLPNTLASDKIDMLDAIIKERRLELFSEWGHRWLDLVRTNRATDILGNLKPDWSPEDMLRPVPQAEIDLNHSLTQNPGY